MPRPRLTQRVSIIALLDKQAPFSHSFVDGMLGKLAGGHPEMTVWLMVSRASATDTRPRRHLNAVLWPVLVARRGLGRLTNLILAWRAGRVLVSRARRRGHAAVLFVRNDPALLLAAALLRSRADRLVFQNSYPHVESAGFTPKGVVARWMYRLARSHIDAVTGVSPLAIERLRGQFLGVRCAEYIPLLADLPDSGFSDARPARSPDAVVQFIYAGSHSQERHLNKVLEAIVAARPMGPAARFTFVGGTTDEIDLLRQVPGVGDLLASGQLRFIERTTRAAVAALLHESDVGICLIPARPQYLESSPTKLAEYLAAGLAVLANDGIPLQAQFVRDSGAGVLVDWERGAIARAIEALCTNGDARRNMQARALAYAGHELSYRSYFPTFCRLIGHEDLRPT